MWSWQSVTRIDLRILPVILGLMLVSLLTLSSYTVPSGDSAATLFEPLRDQQAAAFFTPLVISQLKWCFLGFCVFFFFAGFDYNKLREWTWFLYLLMFLALTGLFFTDSIQRVNRWYRLPFLGMSIQPSEYAKLIVVIALSWFLEKKAAKASLLSTGLGALLIVALPGLLILKQPDLGTALILFPIALGLFYFGGIHPWIVRTMAFLGGSVLVIVALFFLKIVPHEPLRPLATTVLKDYQYDRLDPTTLHQNASLTAISLGGVTGKGWRRSDYTAEGWLPARTTDSAFAAFGEEFGLIGLSILLALFYLLVHLSFQAAASSKNLFGRLLAVGVSIYLAMHMIVNVGMMTGFLPITGVPLILVSYGGSSILSTMTALGILQSIYSRRFMF